MKSKLTITLKRRTLPQRLCRFLILMPFIFYAAIDLLQLPDMVKYLLDVAWIFLLVMMLCFWSVTSARTRKGLLGWVGLFFLYTLVTYLLQYQSGLYYLWGFRNNFRFYAAFFAFTAFLTQQDVEDWLKLFDKLFWLNAAVSLIQFFGFGYAQDNLGGIFGVGQGCNAYTNIFFIIVLTKSIIFYLEKKEKLSQCLAKCAAALLIASLAELKFFFVELIVVVILAVLFTDFSWRKIWVIAGVGAGIVAGAALLVAVFPEFSDFLSFEWFFSAASSDQGYTSSGDLNRLNVISAVNERFFENWPQQVIGFGLGNCDTAAYDFLNTPFYQTYEYLHYTWLSTAFVYLETGYLGLMFFFGFFVLVYLQTRQIERESANDGKAYCRIARIIAVICVLIGIYNSSLRTEAGYMAYFILAIPFVIHRCQPKREAAVEHC